MNYKKKIREKIEKMGGFITSGELVNSNIPTIYLTRMVEAGELVREEEEYIFLQKVIMTNITSSKISIKLQSTRMYLLCIYFNLQTSFLQN